MRRVLPPLLLLFALVAGLPAGAGAAVGAASPVGDWQIGQGGAVVRIAPCESGTDLCGHIVGIMLDHGTPMPSNWRGQSQCGFELIRPSTREGAQWRGRIVNPHNGDRYGAEFHVDHAGDLALRGYLGLPIFGETQHWLPYHGPVPASCRINQTQIATARPDSATRRD